MEWTMTILRPFLLFLLSASLLILCGGCATLPKVSDVIDEADTGSLFKSFRRKACYPGKKQSPDGSASAIRRPDGHSAALQRRHRIGERKPLTSGNKVTLLVDGPATYAAMFKAMENARDHINLETFIIDDDETVEVFPTCC